MTTPKPTESREERMLKAYETGATSHDVAKAFNIPTIDEFHRRIYRARKRREKMEAVA